jgi:hypothetical protein
MLGMEQVHVIRHKVKVEGLRRVECGGRCGSSSSG